jgi:quinol monooxygenase YgiN
MSYVVHVTAVVEGDLEQIESLINDYRYKCLENQSGMEQFFVCRNVEQKNVFLYTQIFKDKQAHKIHLEGNDPKWFFEQMEESNFNFQGQWVAGIEIESSEGQVLN